MEWQAQHVPGVADDDRLAVQPREHVLHVGQLIGSCPARAGKLGEHHRQVIKHGAERCHVPAEARHVFVCREHVAGRLRFRMDGSQLERYSIIHQDC